MAEGKDERDFNEEIILNNKTDTQPQYVLPGTQSQSCTIQLIYMNKGSNDYSVFNVKKVTCSEKPMKTYVLTSRVPLTLSSF